MSQVSPQRCCLWLYWAIRGWKPRNRKNIGLNKRWNWLRSQVVKETPRWHLYSRLRKVLTETKSWIAVDRYMEPRKPQTCWSTDKSYIISLRVWQYLQREGKTSFTWKKFWTNLIIWNHGLNFHKDFFPDVQHLKWVHF